MGATYGVSLAAVGLLTTALFATHLAVQIPGGRLIDRVGARTVGLWALAIVAVANAGALASPSFSFGIGARLVMGIGTGVGFVAGFDLVRAGRGGPLWQGAYGGATMAAGGLALMVVPQLLGPLGWRAPFWTGLALAVAGMLPVLLAPNLPAAQPTAMQAQARQSVLHDRRLWPIAAVQMASFGLSVVAGNWIVTLLERHGHARGVSALAGGLILFAGVITRPLGGIVLRASTRRAWTVAAVSLCTGAAAMLVLAAAPPLWLAALAALVAGLAAGLPFAAIFDMTVRLRADAPAAAVGLVNGSAVLVILVGTPLAGLTFSLPGDGAIAFLVIGLLWAAAVLAVTRVPRAAAAPAPL